MSDNRDEWQQGDKPSAANEGTQENQYAQPSEPAPPAYPGATGGQDASGYPSYGQQDGASPYGQQDGGSPYGQQDGGSPYGQPSASSPYAQPGSTSYGQQDQGYGTQGAYPGQAAYPAYSQDGYPMPRPNPGQAMGIAGLITSFFISVVGLVLSIIGLNQSRKAGMGNVPAVVGIVIGGLGTLMGVIFFIFIMLAIAADPGTSY